MALNFPPSPVLGQEFTSPNGTIWRWDGIKWTFAPQDEVVVDTASDNLIINGNFAVNQRGRVSSAALASGAYGHDRWKAGQTACPYSFMVGQLPDTTISIPTGAGSLLQVIEGGMIEAGVYVLSWEGDATGRVYQGAASGLYAPSPIVTPALPGGVNTIVEFNRGANGTLTKVKFERGLVPTPFNRTSLARNLTDCQRYYQAINGYVTGLKNWSQGIGTDASPDNYETIPLATTMRATPTATFSGVTWFPNPSGGAVPALSTWSAGPSFVSVRMATTPRQNNTCIFNMQVSAEL
jgi:hypothetical protein